MIDPGQLLGAYSEQQVAAFFLVLARVTPLFLLAPLFSSKSIPGRVKGIIAVGLAFGVSQIVRPHGAIDLDPYLFGGLLIKELLVGLAYAFTLGALFAAVTAAGSLLDTLVGFSYGSLIDPVSGNQGSVLSNLYTLIGVLVFIAIDGDAWVIKGFEQTYQLVPLLKAPALGSLVGGAQVAFALVMTSALKIAAPVMLALAITDVGFGVVSRVVPQLNVFAVGFPAKVTVGLVLIGVSMPFVANWLAGELQASVAAALSSLKVA